MNKKRWIPLIVFAISVVMLILGIILFRNRLTVFDTVETDPFPFFAKYLLFSIVAAGVLALFSWGIFNSQKKTHWIIYSAVSFTVLTFCFISIIQSYAIQREVERRDPEYRLTRIALKDFGVTTNGEEMIFYMGRDDCAECVKIHPHLREMAQKYDVEVLYYNTLLDRETNPDALQNILDYYQIDAVPTILVMRNQEIIARFTTEKAAADLGKMLSSNLNPAS